MTIDEMLEILEDYKNQHGGDAEVRIMSQQNWPFENTVHGICCGGEINAIENEDESDVDDDDVEGDAVVYIVEGSQLGYGSKRAWDCCGR